jgi:hypothetical protein
MDDGSVRGDKVWGSGIRGWGSGPGDHPSAEAFEKCQIAVIPVPPFAGTGSRGDPVASGAKGLQRGRA